VNEDKNNDLNNIRGDQITVDESTGVITSDYLSNAKAVLSKLNNVSNCMCLAKWYYSSINLTTGKTQSCYHPAPTDIPADELLNNPSALHNTIYKKNQRAKMLKGERPSECMYCWSIEDSGNGQHLSDRAYRSADLFNEELLQEALQLGAEGNPNPRFVEVVFGNECNFKCSYCAPHQSSLWYNEIFQNGPYKLNDYAHNDLRGLAGLGLLPSPAKTLKYVEAFWKWWPDLYKNLKHFKISGGEPLLDENTYKIFNYVSLNPKKDLQLMLISNCNPPKTHWDKFLYQIKSMAEGNAFDHFMLFYSLDSWGEQAEYIRDGLNFKQSLANLEDFLKNTEKTSVTVVSTFNIFSVVGLKNFLGGVLELRQKYSNNRQKIWIDIPPLHAPDWMSVKLLPKEYSNYIKECIEYVEQNLEKKSNRFKGFKDFELEKIKAIYSQIESNQESETISKLRKDFIKFFNEQDKRRNKNFRKIFPQMQSFFDLCDGVTKSAIAVQPAQGEEVFFNMSPGSYQEYKKKVLDPVSDSFCAAKWYNSTIWLGAGITASCHHPKAHPIPLLELKKDYKALHNTEFKKKQRKMMLEGERPQECEYCWKIEDIDRNNVSDRVFKSIIYKENDVSLLKHKDWKESVDLKTLEISFDRTCNFACSYCNPGFSSTWVKDIKEQGKYTGLSGDAVEHYTTTNDWGQIYKPSEENPYVDAFWKWWPELSKTLFELRVTGGEPLMSPQFWKLVDWFTANEGSRIRFAANSNLGSDQKLIDKLIEKSHFIKTFDLYTSCESIDFQAEYIRDGLIYKNWKNNLINVIEKGHFRKVVIMMTVNALCLFGITDFMDQMLELKNKYGRDYPIMSLNILRYPSFQSAAALPDHIKEKAKNQLQAWFDKNKNSLSLHQFELDGIQRLMDYLDVVKTPNPKAASQEELWKNFKNFYTQYDNRRGKNLYRTFPTLLTDWMDTI
jgi:organic radical activating enzyme